MKKIFILFAAICGLFIGFTSAKVSILTPSYTVNGNDVKLYWTDISDGGYLDVNLRDPKTNGWMHFGEVKMSDQEFTYTKQWNGDQDVQMIRGDEPDEKYEFTISDGKTAGAINMEDMKDFSNSNSESNIVENNVVDNNSEAERTVIPVVPKTGPSGSLILIILATLVIFGGYIYIRKRADI